MSFASSVIFLLLQPPKAVGLLVQRSASLRRTGGMSESESDGTQKQRGGKKRKRREETEKAEADRKEETDEDERRHRKHEEDSRAGTPVESDLESTREEMRSDDGRGTAGTSDESVGSPVRTAILLPSFESIQESLQPEMTARSMSSTRRSSATILRFQELDTNPEVARVMLVICNISERVLNFKIKCGVDSQISAIPSGAGDVEPRGQCRILLTWHRQPEAVSWLHVASPKMLLVTKFKDSGSASTQTRLLGKLNSKKKCTAEKPPEEQLLLDADRDESSLRSEVIGQHINIVLFFVLIYALVLLLRAIAAAK